MGITRLEKEPDHDNIFNSLIEDTVGRDENLWKFAGFCSAQEKRCSIALDSGWGTGKTFFLKQLQMLFDAYNVVSDTTEVKQELSNQTDAITRNNNSNKDSAIKKKTKKSFDVFCNKNEEINIAEKKQIRDKFKEINKKYTGIPIKKHVCFYYDAWLNDNADDPMRSIMYEILSNAKIINPLPKTKWRYRLLNELCRLKCIRKHFFFCSSSVVELAEALFQAMDGLFPMIPVGKVVPFLELLRNNNPVHDIEAQKRFHDAFDAFLNGLILDDNERLLVLIDELDRCKPTYAVQLLERIKHYLSNDRITFVFAINEEQLQHTIKAFYGDEFDAHRYLDRFFDYRPPLMAPDIAKFNSNFEIRIDNKRLRLLNSVCDAFAEQYNMNLRDITRFRLWVKIVCGSFLYKKNFKIDANWRLILFVIIPIVLGLKIHKKELFDAFMSGEDATPLRDVVNKKTAIRTFVCDKNNPFAKNDIPRQPGYFPDLFDPVISIYEKIFKKDKNRIYSASETAFSFDKEMIEAVFQAPTLMADFIDFDTNTEEPAHG